MKVDDLLLRCYAHDNHDNHDVWVAVCVDLAIAVQADSYDDARALLGLAINDYIKEALSIDKKHAAYLLSRKSPLLDRIKYYLIKFKLFRLYIHAAKAFKDPMPIPFGCTGNNTDNKFSTA